MGFPLFNRFKPGDAPSNIPASWLAFVANVLNDLAGTGVRIDKPTSGYGWKIVVLVDGTTIEYDATTKTIRIKDGGLTAAKLATDSVTTVKIADANVTTVKIADANVTTVKIADANVTTAKIADANVTEAKLSTSVAGNGLAGGGGTALSVGVDSSTIEISSDALRVKDLGITTAKIASNAVTNAKTTGYSGTVSFLTPVSISVTNGLVTNIA